VSPRWVVVVTLGVTETISWGILYYAFTVFLSPMETDLNASRGAMAGAFSVALLLAGVAALPVGHWLDARGPWVLMTGGALAATLLVLAWSRVDSLTTLYLVWAGIGVTMATLLYEPAFAVITRWFEHQRLRALTVVTLMAGFASTIFIPLAAWLVEVQGWRQALVTLALVLGAGTIVPHALALRRRPPGREAQSARTTPFPLRSLLRDASFGWLALAFWLTTLCMIGVAVHLVPYLTDRGYPPGFAAVLTGLIGAMQVLARFVVAPLGDRISPRKLATIVLALQPAALLVLLLARSTEGVFAFVALFGAARGLVTLTRPTLVADMYGTAHYASISGVLQMVISIAQAAAPVSVGAGYDAFGSYEPILWLLVGVSSASVLALLGIGRAGTIRARG
jgi:MFS family permease